MEKWIYTDKQLVILATEKSTNKETFIEVLKSDKGWEWFGSKIVEEIIRYFKSWEQLKEKYNGLGGKKGLKRRKIKFFNSFFKKLAKYVWQVSKYYI